MGHNLLIASHPWLPWTSQSQLSCMQYLSSFSLLHAHTGPEFSVTYQLSVNCSSGGFYEALYRDTTGTCMYMCSYFVEVQLHCVALCHMACSCSWPTSQHSTSLSFPFPSQVFAVHDHWTVPLNVSGAFRWLYQVTVGSTVQWSGSGQSQHNYSVSCWEPLGQMCNISVSTLSPFDCHIRA